MHNVVAAVQMGLEIKATLSSETKSSFSDILHVALYYHTIFLDTTLARTYYSLAHEMNSEDPLLLVCWTLFLMGTGERSKKEIEERWLLAREASSVIGIQHLFATANTCFFQFAVLATPTNPMVLMHYALVLATVFNDYEGAERFFRMAMDLKPTINVVIRNYNTFCKKRRRGEEYASSGPSVSLCQDSQELSKEGYWKRLRYTSLDTALPSFTFW